MSLLCFSLLMFVLVFLLFVCSRACGDRASRADVCVDGADERRRDTAININAKWRPKFKPDANVRANAAECDAAIGRFGVAFSFSFGFGRSHAQSQSQSRASGFCCGGAHVLELVRWRCVWRWAC